MHLFIKVENTRHLLTDVHLRDGFFPCIVEHKQEVSIPPMEPAIWCKVLVLDSVLIDCNKRTIRWSTEATASEDNECESWQSLNENISEYDDEDELFHLARAVFHGTRTVEASNVPAFVIDDDSKTSILRMLHCFVLPKVSFNKNDFDKVQSVKMEQLQSNILEALDSKFKAINEEVDESERGFEDAQKAFLTNLIQMINKGQLQIYCSKQFLDSLLQSLGEDLEQQSQKLDKAKDYIATATQNCSFAKSLDEVKDGRRILEDKVKLLLDALLEIKRELKQNRDFPEVMKEQSDVFLQYHWLTEKRAAFKRKEIERNIIKQKQNCASIVQEMLNKILNDLRQFGYSQLNGANVKGLRPTDVLQTWLQPEWQRLSEQVATLVFDPGHPVGASFEQLCSQIHDMCQTCLDQERISSKVRTRSHSQLPELFSCVPLKSNIDHHHDSYESLPVTDNQDPNPYQEKLEALKMTIFAYFEDTTEVLSELIINKSGDPHLKNKLRIAFESYFYQKIECAGSRTTLTKVYKLVNKDHVTHLRDNIGRLKKLPIELFKLPINDAYAWLFEVFNQRRSMREPISLIYPQLQSAENDESEDESKIPSVSVDNVNITSISFSMARDQYQTPDDTMFLSKSLQEEWESRAKLISKSLKRALSPSFSEVTDTDQTPSSQEGQEWESRAKSFGKSLKRALSKSFSKVTDTAQSCSSQEGKESELNEPHLSGSFLDKWESKASFREVIGTDTDPALQGKEDEEEVEEMKNGDIFEEYFGPVLQHIRDILKAASPLDKLKKMVTSMREISNKLEVLSMKHGGTSTAATADDLLTILILMLLQMEPCDVASLWPQLAMRDSMLDDLMPSFLVSGHYGWAWTHFNAALQFLDELSSEF